jgi:GST-like protein
VLAGDADPLLAYPNVKRWFTAINSRPAAARARAVGKDIAFKQEMDEEAKRAMFPSNYPLSVV